MTDQQRKFFELAKAYEVQKDKLSEIRDQMELVMKELGLETYHQDPDTSIVYKIHQPQGTFISFRTVDYKRTAKEGERGGTVLSKKEAEEMGFTVKKG